ncbi:MAG: hypothetical protein METHP_01180 [Methanoregula sp. SKADARSKE-2]|nr:MAG: hypothetical protein METHP_01180 [Methanoregula sp. SKADARSKE-2]
MKRRLTLAMGRINDPRLIFPGEPGYGLESPDPEPLRQEIVTHTPRTTGRRQTGFATGSASIDHGEISSRSDLPVPQRLPIH